MFPIKKVFNLKIKNKLNTYYNENIIINFYYICKPNLLSQRN